MQFLPIKQTYYSFMNLPDCSCTPYALYITENFSDNNRPLFRHSCVTVTHLRTHTCIPLRHWVLTTHTHSSRVHHFFIVTYIEMHFSNTELCAKRYLAMWPYYLCCRILCVPVFSVLQYSQCCLILCVTVFSVWPYSLCGRILCVAVLLDMLSCSCDVYKPCGSQRQT